ncbi:hypothetical protein BU23DRAFT_633403 [Bimuria novae-zelandiae CBS 107.79]|uniref:Uncharacterized protein n=1 Tax=Bimuria novae-zelandiae CBS 107.79 TaxID=1447943 RepID=A0A6A5VE61_9PLEO|nr:hypothetical protein BU23DRAFT_633403 [Bimuria novae-zelandiae CBS 107.79]
MARVRGSLRQKPPSRSPEMHSNRSVNGARSTYNHESFYSADNPSSMAGPSTPITGRSNDGPANEQHFLEKGRLGADDNEVAQDNGKYVRSEDSYAEWPGKPGTRPNAPTSLAGTGASSARPTTSSLVGQIQRQRPSRLRRYHGDAFLEQDVSTEDLGTARFETKEVVRQKKYQRENKLLNEVHDRAVIYSLSRQPKLQTRNWEDSKEVNLLTQKSDRPQVQTKAKKAQDRLPLRGERKEPALSPVFQIAPLDSDYESDPLEILEGSIPGPPIDNHATAPVNFPPLVNNPQLDRQFSQQYLYGERRQMLSQRYLFSLNHRKDKHEVGMTAEEMSVFVDFDRGLGENGV